MFYTQINTLNYSPPPSTNTNTCKRACSAIVTTQSVQPTTQATSAVAAPTKYKVHATAAAHTRIRLTPIHPSHLSPSARDAARSS